MSYLGPLRVHFAGRFLAAVSTRNNTSTNFAAQTPDAAIVPGFNEPGSGDWRLVDVAVTGAHGRDGAPAAPDDPVLAALVADSDHLAPAKIVDLDTEQQLVSAIWGLEVRIATPEGHNLLRGRFEPAAFLDIWIRATGVGAGPGGDNAAAAMFQSVLTDVEWGDVEGSAVLTALRTTSGERLSVKFNLDLYGMNGDSPSFLTGRIVGTIGPAAPGEPDHFVLGRHLLAAGRDRGFFLPANKVNFAVASVDETSRRIHVDLGNALPVDPVDGRPSDLGDLTLVAVPPPGPTGPPPPPPTPLGVLRGEDYRKAGWYGATAGIVLFPPDRELTDEEMQAVAVTPLVLRRTGPDHNPLVLISEPDVGIHVRADRFVYRLDPHEHADVRVFATWFGQRYPGCAVAALPYEHFGRDIPLPAGADAPVVHPDRLVTGEDGVAVLPLDALEIGTPRGYLDGQLYGIRLAPELTLGGSELFDPQAFVNVLVWSAFTPDDPPTWWGAVQPIFAEYARLYPVMRRFLDMADYASVARNARALEFALSLDVTDPNHMPVTRDLSGPKRAAILHWLRTPGEDGNPLLGEPPPQADAPGPPEALDLVPAPQPDAMELGGKTAAARRVAASLADQEATP